MLFFSLEITLSTHDTHVDVAIVEKEPIIEHGINVETDGGKFPFQSIP